MATRTSISNYSLNNQYRYKIKVKKQINCPFEGVVEGRENNKSPICCGMSEAYNEYMGSDKTADKMFIKLEKLYYLSLKMINGLEIIKFTVY